MTNLNRIPVPSFETVLEQLMTLALEHPTKRSQGHGYLNPFDGQPSDIVAHVVHNLGADLRAFDGHRLHHVIAKQGIELGTAYNNVRFPILWDRIFISDPMFLGVTHDDKLAEDYAVCALLDHVAKVSWDDLTWLGAARKGISNFRRFFFSASSGFLIQVTTHPEGRAGNARPTMIAFENRVDDLTSKARQAIIAKHKELLK